MLELIVSPKCTACGTCISVCTKKLLTFEDGYPRFKPGARELCMKCGHCTVFCPEAGNLLNCFFPEQLRKSESYSPATREQVRNVLENRRSYRLFSRLPVPQDALDQILATTAYYPSGKNIRPVRLVVINNPRKVHELADKIVSWMETESAKYPECGDPEVLAKLTASYRKGNDFIFRRAPSVVFMVVPKDAVWGTVDATIAATYFNLSAETFDIGCTFAGYAVRMLKNAPEIRQWLGLSEDEVIPIGLFFGRKAIPTVRIPAREPIPVTYL